MFNHLLESSHRDDSNKWSNIGFGQEMKELASIEIHFTHLIWRSEHTFGSRSSSMYNKVFNILTVDVFDSVVH